MKHTEEFSKQANTYDKNTDIQKRVASHLLSKIDFQPKKIIDLGCGTGDIYRKISWEYDKFIGVDFAKGMCQKHPQNPNTIVLNANFEDENFQKNITQLAPFDLVISSSALQWSKDIEKIFQLSANLSEKIAFSIFTCNTFKDIYEISGLKTFLPNAKDLVVLAKKYFDIEYEIKTYRLDFEDNISKFRYIKKSGVSGGTNQLSLTQTKELIEKYPHKYLEFEVLFIHTK